MTKVFITRKIVDGSIDLLKQKGLEVVVGGEGLPLSKSQLQEGVKGAAAIIAVVGDKIDKDVIESAGPNLKIIASCAVGYDHIDVEEAQRRGIYVTHTPAANAWCVAEHTFALILNLCHRILEGDNFVRQGLYKGFDPELLMGDEIKNNVLGIVGLGAIGSFVAQIAQKGFGMKVLYYDIIRNEKLEAELNLTHFSNLDDLIKQSDILSLHTPLNKNTYHLINKEKLNLMKPSAYLINTSRGPVIDEVSLYEALKDSKIKGAALDVFENEPEVYPGLKDLKNVILTPHIAASSYEARVKMSEMAVSNVIAALEGRVPPNVVK